MKYRLPEDCVGLSHAGVTFEPSADGLIEADAALVPHLVPHGIFPVDLDDPSEKKGGKSEGRRSSR